MSFPMTPCENRLRRSYLSDKALIQSLATVAFAVVGMIGVGCGAARAQDVQETIRQQQYNAALAGVPPFCTTYNTCTNNGAGAFANQPPAYGYPYYTGPCGYALNFGLLDLLGSCPLAAAGDDRGDPTMKYAPARRRHPRRVGATR